MIGPSLAAANKLRFGNGSDANMESKMSWRIVLERVLLAALAALLAALTQAADPQSVGAIVLGAAAVDPLRSLGS